MYRQAQQYRRRAIVAKQQGADATTPTIKEQLEVIAEHWLALAEQVEWMEGLLLHSSTAPQQQVVLQQQQRQQQQAHASAEGSTALPQPPFCAKCGTVMRLQGSVPTRSNLDQLRYVCDCGEVSEKAVASQD
jgi:hypothetical protein